MPALAYETFCSLFLATFLPFLQTHQIWPFRLYFSIVWNWQEADELRPSKFNKLEESVLRLADI